MRYLKKRPAAFLHFFGVTLQLLSDSNRSAMVINTYLPIDQAGGNYCSDRRNLKKQQQYSSNIMLEFFIRGVTYNTHKALLSFKNISGSDENSLYYCILQQQIKIVRQPRVFYIKIPVLA
jgi:hypothetical protein